MPRLRFTILGCGASPGVPRINGDWGACDPSEPRNRRTRCSAMVERFDGDSPLPTRIVIDTGPDFHPQMLAAGVGHIDAVVYTHPHADHIHGIDDLRTYWLSSGRRIEIFADAQTEARLFEGFGYCFRSPPGSNYPPILNANRIIPGLPWTIDGPGGPILLRPFRQYHGDIDSLGLRVGSIAYSCDFKGAPSESLGELEGLDLWVIDALRIHPHPSHVSLSEALEWIARMKPARALLTHMTNDLDYLTMLRDLPSGVEPAHDGWRIEFEVAD
jgi:phosphoribosyl 1,2-cyclic phosphate phosphodiesterase